MSPHILNESTLLYPKTSDFSGNDIIKAKSELMFSQTSGIYGLSKIIVWFKFIIVTLGSPGIFLCPLSSVFLSMSWYYITEQSEQFQGYEFLTSSGNLWSGTS